MHTYKKYFIGLGILLLIFTAVYYSVRPLGFRVRIGEAIFRTEVAATPEEKMKGLGYRDTLAQDAAMLFPYDHKDMYPFWMKGMNFPLDFVWIDGTTVVDLSENVVPAGTPSYNTVMPKVPVDKVLELNAGMIQKYQIKVGDTVTFLQK